MTRRNGTWRRWSAVIAAATLAVTLTGCGSGKDAGKDSKEQAAVTPAQIREIAKQAYREGRPILDVAAEKTDLGRERLAELLNPEKLTGSD